MHKYENLIVADVTLTEGKVLIDENVRNCR